MSKEATHNLVAWLGATIICGVSYYLLRSAPASSSPSESILPTIVILPTMLPLIIDKKLWYKAMTIAVLVWLLSLIDLMFGNYNGDVVGPLGIIAIMPLSWIDVIIIYSIYRRIPPRMWYLNILLGLVPAALLFFVIVTRMGLFIILLNVLPPLTALVLLIMYWRSRHAKNFGLPKVSV